MSRSEIVSLSEHPYSDQNKQVLLQMGKAYDREDNTHSGIWCALEGCNHRRVLLRFPKYDPRVLQFKRFSAFTARSEGDIRACLEWICQEVQISILSLHHV